MEMGLFDEVVSILHFRFRWHHDERNILKVCGIVAICLFLGRIQRVYGVCHLIYSHGGIKNIFAGFYWYAAAVTAGIAIGRHAAGFGYRQLQGFVLIFTR